MRLRGIVYAFSGSLIFGLGAVLANIIGREIAVTYVALLTLGIGGLLIAAGLLVTGTSLRKVVLKLNRRDWLNLFLLAFPGTSLPLLLIVAGFAQTSALVGGFLLQLNGVAGLAFAVILLRERIRWKQGLGIVLLLGGSVLVVFSGANGGGSGSNNLLGDALIFLGAIGIGFGFIPAKRLSGRVATMPVTALRLLLGAITVLPLLAIQLLLGGGTLAWHPSASTLWVALPAYIVLNFCLAYLAQQESLRLLAAWEVAAIMQTVPIFSTLFSVLILHDSLTLLQVLGGVVALLGGLVVSVSDRTPLPASTIAPMATDTLLSEVVEGKSC